MARELGQWVVALDGGSIPDPALIGGKAHSIARMQSLGLRVPAAFVVTTEACRSYFESGGVPAGLATELALAVSWLEAQTGRGFGHGPVPLLVSVRSGAAVSMPGMMDTILNLGMNTAAVEALTAETGNRAFAEDTRRRFGELYTSIVIAAGSSGSSSAAPPGPDRLGEGRKSAAIPEEPFTQLLAAVRAVFDSWNSSRARRYRQHHGISDQLGTAVTVQAMAYGNLDDASGTGVLFTRNPLTGAPEPFGEFLPRAQGEDVVSGRHNPLPLSALGHAAPGALDQLLSAARLLEREYRDMQDVEFTVERGRLYLLQTRSGKRTAEAAIRIALDLVREGVCDVATSFERLSLEQIRAVVAPRLRSEMHSAVSIARGEGACPGIGRGIVVLDPDEAEARTKAGDHVVLARLTTSPADLHGLIAAQAVITERGGTTSHAAVVCRALGRPCVVGCGESTVTRLAGRTVTVDGRTGMVFDGLLEVAEIDEDADDTLRQLVIRAQALAPIRVERTAPAGMPVIDLDAFGGTPDPARLEEHLRRNARGAAVGGGSLADVTVLEACVAAGVEVLVASPRLPVLLSMLKASAITKRSKPRGQRP